MSPELQEAAAMSLQVEEGREAVGKKGGGVAAVSSQKLLSYADVFDWVLMGLGTLGSVVHGMAQPLGYLLLGKALGAFGSNIHDTEAMVKAPKEGWSVYCNCSLTFNLFMRINSKLSVSSFS